MHSNVSSCPKNCSLSQKINFPFTEKCGWLHAPMLAITLELFTSQIPDDQERWLHRWMESHEYLHRHQRCHEWQLETEHWQCRRHRDLELLAAQLVYLRQVRRLQRLKWWFRQPSRSLLYRLQVYWAVSLFSLYITHTHTYRHRYESKIGGCTVQARPE